MGYYTSYSISFEPEQGSEEQEEQFKEALIKRGQEMCCREEIEDLLECGVYAKLYDLDRWIAELAPKFPNLLICLSGDGEESDDLWEMRWKGYEQETKNAIIPPFENEKLFTNQEKNNLK